MQPMQIVSDASKLLGAYTRKLSNGYGAPWLNSISVKSL